MTLDTTKTRIAYDFYFKSVLGSHWTPPTHAVCAAHRMLKMSVHFLPYSKNQSRLDNHHNAQVLFSDLTILVRLDG